MHSDAAKFLQIVWNVCAIAFLCQIIFNVQPAFGLVLAVYLICGWLVGLFFWGKIIEQTNPKNNGSKSTTE